MALTDAILCDMQSSVVAHTLSLSDTKASLTGLVEWDNNSAISRWKHGLVPHHRELVKAFLDVCKGYGLRSDMETLYVTCW